MAHLKVILTEDIENLGRVGDIVNVKPGYGRNYLVPQGKALSATPANLAVMGARRKVYEAAAARAKGDAELIAQRIVALEVTVARKVGEAETLYGSVTTSDVAMALEDKGVLIDKRRILLAEPLKKLGAYEIPIRLHPDVTAQLRLAVVPEAE
jgi:large subunit ribosomal protein L9